LTLKQKNKCMKNIIIFCLLLSSLPVISQLKVGADISNTKYLGFNLDNKAYMHGITFNAGVPINSIYYECSYTLFNVGSYSHNTQVLAKDINTVPQTIQGDYRVYPRVNDFFIGAEYEFYSNDSENFKIYAGSGGGIQILRQEYRPQFSTETYHNFIAIGYTPPTLRVYTQIGLGFSLLHNLNEFFVETNFGIMDNLFGIISTGYSNEFFLNAKLGVRKTIDFSKKEAKLKN
jgi:hypothetical protein